MWLIIDDHAIDKHGDSPFIDDFVPNTFSQLITKYGARMQTKRF